jgi:hypothetical protein
MRKFLLLIFCFVFSCCKACECPPIDPVSKKNADNYDVIFYGKVDSIVPCGNSGIGTAYFTIINLYKGAAEQKISIDYDCTSACMMSFVKNDEWIIYSMYQKFDLLTVNICSHSRKKIIDSSADFYQVSSGRTFDQENELLKKIYGVRSFSSHNQLNDQQKEFQPHNEQPSAINKLWLLLISLLVMIVIFFISKKFFKNDK